MKVKLGDLPIIWINLEKDIPRRQYMQKVLVGHSNYRISAVDTKKVTDFTKKVPPKIAKKYRTEMACLVSHFLALEHVVNKGYEAALILEDDTSISGLNMKNTSLAYLPKTWDVLQLFTSSVEFYDEVDKKVFWARWTYENTSAGAYILKRSAAKRILSRYFKDRQIDYEVIKNNPQYAVADLLVYDREKSYTCRLPIAHEKQYPSNFGGHHTEYSNEARRMLIERGLIAGH